MEIWIRSQDKETLIKVDKNIFIHNEEVVVGQQEYEDDYQNSLYENVVGVYKTKERAIEILDEIQDKVDYAKRVDRLLSLNPNYNNTTIIQPQSFVYEMPKD